MPSDSYLIEVSTPSSTDFRHGLRIKLVNRRPADWALSIISRSQKSNAMEENYGVAFQLRGMIHLENVSLFWDVFGCYRTEGRDKVHDLCSNYEGQMSTVTARLEPRVLGQ